MSEVLWFYCTTVLRRPLCAPLPRADPPRSPLLALVGNYPLSLLSLLCLTLTALNIAKSLPSAHTLCCALSRLQLLLELTELSTVYTFISLS